MTRHTSILLPMILCCLCGCSRQDAEPAPTVHSSIGVLEFAATDPASPAILNAGQKLIVLAYYRLEDNRDVLIWARPFTSGRNTPGYRAQHLTPIGQTGPREGILEMWFYFDEPAKVDQVRIFAADAATDTVLLTATAPIDIAWK